MDDLKNNGYGTIIILNGTPRSGKSSIASVIQNTFDGIWLNLGVDNHMRTIPEQLRPGIGLRPGGERPDLEPVIRKLYAALYESIAAHSRLGLHVVADFGHHDSYSVRLDILRQCAVLVSDCPVLLVGVRCPVETVMERRIRTWEKGYEADGSIPEPVLLWQKAVHEHALYDLEVDTSIRSPEQCAALIKQRMEAAKPWTAMRTLAGLPSSCPSGAVSGVPSHPQE